MTTNAIPLTKFVFHVHKPKAAMLAKLMVKASRHALYDLKVTEDHHPVADRVGIFYGVVPETYAAFRYYMADPTSGVHLRVRAVGVRAARRGRSGRRLG